MTTSRIDVPQGHDWLCQAALRHAPRPALLVVRSRAVVAARFGLGCRVVALEDLPDLGGRYSVVVVDTCPAVIDPAAWARLLRQHLDLHGALVLVTEGSLDGC